MIVQSLDARLLVFINHETANRFFDILMPALSRRGFLLVIPFLPAMLALAALRRTDGVKTYLAAALWTVLIACCAVFIAELTESALKAAIARPRPCRTIEGLRLIVACPKSYSMPSGHSISSFAFALPLYYLSRAYVARIWRLYPLLLAALIAFSRLYLGVHYPTDVLAGTLLGSAIGLGLSVVYEKMSVGKSNQEKS